MHPTYTSPARDRSPDQRAVQISDSRRSPPLADLAKRPDASP
jgi:hypothetical protein